MKISKEFFTNLSKQKYLELVRSRINLREEKTQNYATIILSLIAFIFFAVFAILPTLTTIFELQKRLDDNKFVHDKLAIKITSLSNLSNQYSQITPDLKYINAAIPSEPSGPSLIAKVRTIANNNNVFLNQLQITNIPLSQLATAGELAQFNMVIGAQGEYSDLINFYTEITNFDRLVTFKNISLQVPTELNGYRLYLQAKVFYLP
ncbi:MAG: type 4a pilus biogenesis protein PilO [Candidatus Levybacteria bacterium]|nr:type 4a pilus biogenesis protein PilO [Candidatus Levybacteria bacterium]